MLMMKLKKLVEHDSIVVNSTLTAPGTTIELPNKAYFDSVSGYERRSRDMSSVFNSQDNQFDII